MIAYGEYKGIRTVKMFMQYVKAKFKEKQQELIYRIYITDSLYYYSKEMAPSKRYAEIIGLVEQDKRSGDEIALDIVKKAGLKLKR